ncbi:CLUMA_CG014374, isoform A [Clunio marinus]|uniref:ABC-type xenobiotic transporter n=1 Tax=Clunio marinus TaxID=568069 RepID=A0A1J1ILI7_9DIPT|nr:CLUMA_CG014374, isoform A [Clunio marinus]
MNNEGFTWNWEEFCETGLNITSNISSIAPCFQQIHIQLPTYAWLSIFSAFHYGKLSTEMYRNRTQMICLNLRALIALALAVVPVIQILNSMDKVKIWPVDILLTCVQFLAWTVHFALITGYKKYGNLSHRGPLILLVLWSGSLSLSILWFQTSLNFYYWPYSLSSMILNILYGFTLIMNGKSERIINEAERERDVHINTYHRLSVDGGEEAWILGSAYDGFNFFSKLNFHWVNPLIKKGVLGKLRRNEDLFDLPEFLNIKKLFEKLKRSLDVSKSLFKALHRSFGVEFYSIGILRLLSDISNFAGPLLLGGLLRVGTDDGTENDDNGKAYYYAAGLFFTTLLSAIAGVHFNWKISMVSMKMRSALVSTIYMKGLEAKGLHEAKPEILNLMSTDTDRIVNSCISFHSFWSIPFQLFTTLYLLYTQLGVGFVSGVIFAVLLIPINRYIAQKIGKLSAHLMTAKDKRVQLTTEALTGAKQIKMQSLEDLFTEKIEDLRQNELVFLSKRKYLDAWCVYFWATTPVLMCLLTFGGLVLMGQQLTASTTYTSVALLNLLIGPLNSFPWILNGLMEAYVSLKRVQELINLDDINLSAYYSPVLSNFTSKSSESPIVLSVKNGSFRFDQDRDKTSENLTVEDFKLENVNIEVHSGDLVCIEGSVGGGKTALLNALLGNMKRTQGVVALNDKNSGFAYVSQVPWLQRGTIRENICWGAIYDESRYHSIINCCALREEIEKLGGDHVGIGENGKTLSGGQKLRCTLARALYQDKKIYILDDFLSALDAHVAAYIVKHCIFGLLSKKTRIIVSQNKSLLDRASQIIHVENGIVSCLDLINDDDDYYTDDEMDQMNYSSVLRQTPTQLDCDNRSIDSCLMDEGKKQGNLSSNVVGCYWKSMGRFLGFVVLLSVLLMQASRNLTDGWLAHWVSVSDGNHTNKTNSVYLQTFTTFAVTNSFITLIRSFLFAYAGIKAAKSIHERLLMKVFQTKLQFFDVVPLGRILNRFSSDTYTIDDSLPFILNILLAQVFGLLGSICVSLYALPWLGLIIAPLCPIYLDIQSKYRNSSRDIKRLSSNALSPLYIHFTETLQGLTTIRAMRATRRFQQDFTVKLEESIRAQVTASAASCWLQIRLQLLGAVVVGGAGVLTAMTSAHTTSPGMVGLAISYALSISGLLSGVLSAFSETEQEMIAVERVSEYLKLPEEPNADGSSDPPFSWPHQGVIKFKNVFMSYREHLIPALNGISFETSSYERVGIVGRTGAGKSSIINALLRVSDATRGEIVIDNVNIDTLPLSVLRNRIAIVPQEPFLFSGSVRDNLDPRSLHLDSEIWNAITHCLTSPLVSSLGGLSGRIESGGSNLSSGQKQLLCLTRALLKSAKIVLIDEGTSNLDNESELAIQIALRNAFKTSTVLIIAHRLNGLQNTDRILVISDGELVESGEFWNLAKDDTSYLHKMLEEQKSNIF